VVKTFYAERTVVPASDPVHSQWADGPAFDGPGATAALRPRRQRAAHLRLIVEARIGSSEYQAQFQPARAGPQGH
jgi:hypothetical protein